MPDVFIKPNKNLKSEEKDKIASSTKPLEAHSHPFASFCQHPFASFRDQEGDENILLLLRAHFVTNFSWIFFSLFFAFLPLILIASGNLYSFFSFLPNRFINVILVFYYLIIFNYAFINLITWYYNIFIVTQKRAIDIDFSDLVYHNVAMTKLNLVEDVNYTQVGFISSLFNFGNLFVQTAGETKNFEAKNVPKPGEAVSIIEDLIGGPR